MAQFSFDYVKRNPVMFGGIVIVFGLLFWFLFNRGSSGTTIVESGPTDAQIAAGTQLQLAQAAANVEAQRIAAQLESVNVQAETTFALAGLELQYQLADIAASERIATRNAEFSLEALTREIDASLFRIEAENDFQLTYARQAQESAQAQLEIGAQLQRELAAMQSEAFRTSAILSVVPSLKKKDRDNFLHSFIGSTTIPTRPGGGGGSGLLGAVGDVIGGVPGIVF